MGNDDKNENINFVLFMFLLFLCSFNKRSLLGETFLWTFFRNLFQMILKKKIYALMKQW